MRAETSPGMGGFFNRLYTPGTTPVITTPRWKAKPRRVRLFLAQRLGSRPNRCRRIASPLGFVRGSRPISLPPIQSTRSNSICSESPPLWPINDK